MSLSLSECLWVCAAAAAMSNDCALCLCSCACACVCVCLCHMQWRLTTTTTRTVFVSYRCVGVYEHILLFVAATYSNIYDVLFCSLQNNKAQKYALLCFLEVSKQHIQAVHCRSYISSHCLLYFEAVVALSICCLFLLCVGFTQIQTAIKNKPSLMCIWSTFPCFLCAYAHMSFCT